MIKNLMTAAAIGAALIASPTLAGPGPANTAGQNPAKSMEVKYSDLNLATAAGQEQLARRIDVAARKVCGVGKHRTGTRIPSTQRKACFAKARQSARNQMASAMNDARRGG